MQARNPSKVRKVKAGMNNNRKLTPAREQMRVGLFGIKLPRRLAYNLQRLRHFLNMHLAYKREIRDDLRGFDTPEDRKNAIHFLKYSKKQKYNTKAEERIEKWNPVLEMQQRYTAMDQMGVNRANIAKFVKDYGYTVHYSGKNKLLYLRPKDLNAEVNIPALIESAFGFNLPFKLRFSQ